MPNYHARENVHLRSADGRTLVLSYLHAVDEGAANRAIKLVRCDYRGAPQGEIELKGLPAELGEFQPYVLGNANGSPN